MAAAERIARGVTQVAGPTCSCADDAAAFVIAFADELVMIDCGTGRSLQKILTNMAGAGLNPHQISTLLLTHCHIDHIGTAPELRRRFGCRILIHDLDADPVETGDHVRTAADWYDTDFPPTPIDERLTGETPALSFGGEVLHGLHMPGHTPGSVCFYLDRDGQRILFGQDIHGPFLPAFGSDIGQWRTSMGRVLALGADILCEGHCGIFQPRQSVIKYMEGMLRRHA